MFVAFKFGLPLPLLSSLKSAQGETISEGCWGMCFDTKLLCIPHQLSQCELLFCAERKCLRTGRSGESEPTKNPDNAEFTAIICGQKQGCSVETGPCSLCSLSPFLVPVVHFNPQVLLVHEIVLSLLRRADNLREKYRGKTVPGQNK